MNTDPLTTIRITIDGGISRNPGGNSYGSFEFKGTVHRCKYGGGSGHTNNTAEVQTAVAALYYAAEHVQHAHLTDLVFMCDSMLCCNWINRGTNPRTGQTFRLAELLARFRRQAKAFKSVRMEWQPREESVAVLGH